VSLAGDADGPSLAVAGAGRREVPEVEAELVSHGRVVSVAGEVLHADLPVGLRDPVVRRTVHLAAPRPLLEVHVQVELETAQVLLEGRGRRVQRAEHQSGVGLGADLHQPPLGAVEPLLVALLLVRHADQLPEFL
jgi:hypothetical protein